MEANYSIEYILLDDYKARSSAWLVGYYLNQRKFLQSQLPDTDSGKRFQIKLKSDRFAQFVKFKNFDLGRITQEIEKIDRMLSKEKFKSIHAQFQKRNIRYWYQINNGPTSMKDVAKKLQRPLYYEIEYRRLSSNIHARDASDILTVLNGKLVFSPIRSANEITIDTICIGTGSHLINACKFVGKKFRPDENVNCDIKEIMKQHGRGEFTQD